MSLRDVFGLKRVGVGHFESLSRFMEKLNAVMSKPYN